MLDAVLDEMECTVGEPVMATFGGCWHPGCVTAIGGDGDDVEEEDEDDEASGLAT